jgi:hypothetical protein
VANTLFPAKKRRIPTEFEWKFSEDPDKGGTHVHCTHHCAKHELAVLAAE